MTRYIVEASAVQKCPNTLNLRRRTPNKRNKRVIDQRMLNVSSVSDDRRPSPAQPRNLSTTALGRRRSCIQIKRILHACLGPTYQSKSAGQGRAGRATPRPSRPRQARRRGYGRRRPTTTKMKWHRGIERMTSPTHGTAGQNRIARRAE